MGVATGCGRGRGACLVNNALSLQKAVIVTIAPFHTGTGKLLVILIIVQIRDSFSYFYTVRLGFYETVPLFQYLRSIYTGIVDTFFSRQWFGFLTWEIKAGMHKWERAPYSLTCEQKLSAL